MSYEGLQPIPRGETFYNGSTIDTSNLGGVHLEGQLCEFSNAPTPTANNVTTFRDESRVKCRIVRNVAAAALLPGYAVTYASGYRYRRVDGYSRTTAQEIAGIIDDRLPTAGVAVNDLCNIIVEGQVLAKTPLAGTEFAEAFVVGDILYALTAATSGATTSGRLKRWNGTFAAADTTDGSAGNILANYCARALSAKTTGNTNADVLVYVKVY